MKLVSVVVSVYNIERYIENCILSLVAQTYKNIEIILVDDGATDKSGDICDYYMKKDSRIRVIHKKNGGLSDARNRGARECKGEYIFFVDGDDTVSPRMVEKAVGQGERYNADMVIFDFESIEQVTGRRDRYTFNLPQDRSFTLSEVPELLLKTPAAWCRMYKKSFWDCTEIRYPENLYYEDLATTPRLIYEAKRICYAGEEPLYYYLLRQGSIMRNRNFQRSFHDRTCVLDFIRKYYIDRKADRQYKNELEYLFFEHGYFVPSKEIVLEDFTSPWLIRFKDFIIKNYPDFLKNPYIKKMSLKDKILLGLMEKKMYAVMNLLSNMRKKKDFIKTQNRR